MSLLLLQRLKEAGRTRKTLVPCSFTLLNACLGFIAVLAATDQKYMLATVCIILAACMDSLDGRIARAMGVVSTLGMELDSLSDAISFCLAPAIMFYCWWSEQALHYGLIVSLIYLAAGLVRLARFNSTPQKMMVHFIGLPTPAAAIISAVLITCCVPTLVAMQCVAWCMLLLALLMVSTITFPSFK